MKIFVLLLFSFILLPFNILTAEKCEERASYKNLKISLQNNKKKECLLSADYNDEIRLANNNRNRSYTFYPSSMMMVFIGTDDYEYMSKATGARMFHFLPFKEKKVPSFEEKEEDAIFAQLPNGYGAFFSKTTGELASLEGFRVKTSPIEHFDQMAKKQGGIEITPEKGFLLIDYGWRTGEIPITQLWRTPVIYDGYGSKCTVKMSDLFERDPNDKDEVIFKFNSNEELNLLLKKRCPKIKYSF